MIVKRLTKTLCAIIPVFNNYYRFAIRRVGAFNKIIHHIANNNMSLIINNTIIHLKNGPVGDALTRAAV
jgi:hypothetical protein